jgi:hypothetical protein
MRAWFGLLACAWLLACSEEDSPGRGPLPATRGDGGEGICTADGACEQSVAVGAPQHLQGTIDYPDPPPAGGQHNPCWGDFGVHDEELPAENWVHNLEHGAVVYLHDCPGGCDAELEQLSELVRERPFALLTPFPGLPTRFAVVAWGYRLESDELDLPAFEAFYEAHHDRGLESSTSGAPSGCP